MVYYSKRMYRHNQSGFAHVGLILIALVVVGGIGVATWKVFGSTNKQKAASDTIQQAQTPAPENKTTEPSATLIWQQAEGGWRFTMTPPECPPQPMMKMPADISKVTGILYPGQTRGGNYKPHGGFRFDNTANDKVQVTAPTDGFIVRGGQYLAEGEIQYTFDIMHNCGVMYRVGHFRALPDNLQKLADTWPPAQEGDSRTQQVNPPVYVKQGEVLATAVGIIKDKNTFFDWGVYDYRQQNQVSQTAAYQQAHSQEKELAWHAVCWFDWLPSSDKAKVKSLPAGDPTSGKKSDYCT
jgi:hypothetical protein